MNKKWIYRPFALFIISLLTMLLISAFATPPQDAYSAVYHLAGHRQIFTEANAKNVEFVGRMGGPAYTLAIQGNLAYVSEGYGLTILDITDPLTPFVVGRTPRLPEIVEDIAVKGDFAYLVAPVGYYGDGVMRIINVFDPTAPVEVGFFDLSGSANGVALDGDYAYVADGASGLRIIDIADPTAPVEVSFSDTPGDAKKVTIAGTFAYIADENGGLRIVDISDPTKPVGIGSYNPVDLGPVKDVAVQGHYAYIADRDRGMLIVDISDPTKPLGLGSYDTPQTAQAITVAGSYAYLGDERFGLRIIDISDPAQPAEAGHYGNPDWSDVLAVEVSGDYVFIVEDEAGNVSLPDSVVIIDASDPADPVAVATYKTLRNVRAVAVDGDTAYACGGFWFIDVSEPTIPIAVGDVDSGGSRIVLEGNIAYLAAGDRGVRIVYIANPEVAEEIGHYEWQGSASDLEVQRDFVYVADGSTGGLRIIDASDPTDPVEISYFNIPAWTGYQGHVVVAGNYAYTGYWDGHNLITIDISDPAKPDQVSSYNLPGPMRDLAVDGNFAYVGTGSHGLRIIDISNPATPVEVGYKEEEAHFITVSGNYVFVGSFYEGSKEKLIIFDVTDPANPIEVGFYDTHIEDMAVAGNYIYVAQWNEGMSILRLNNPVKVDFSVSPTSGPPPLTVSFTNLSSGDFDSCIWDFGDGEKSNACADQKHTYTKPGKFQVSLTVSGPGGEGSKTKEIIVLIEKFQSYMPSVLGK